MVLLHKKVPYRKNHESLDENPVSFPPLFYWRSAPFPQEIQEENILVFFPGAQRREIKSVHDFILYQVYHHTGTVGCTLVADSGRFRGPIRLLVVFDREGILLEITVLEHTEDYSLEAPHGRKFSLSVSGDPLSRTEQGTARSSDYLWSHHLLKGGRRGLQKAYGCAGLSTRMGGEA